jgi:glyoxylase-like metal-dependent hydrolase (beta-lactamase superfamily II)
MIHRRDIETLFAPVWSEHNATDFIFVHGGPKIEITGSMFMHIPGFEPAAPDGYLQDEQLLDLGGRDLLVLYTPGHAPGHCCFVLPEEGAILSGDHVLPKITPHVGYFPGGPENPLAEYIDSLKRVGEGSYRIGLPAHGEPFLDPASRVARIVRHHEFRLLAIADALGHEAKTAWAVIPIVFGDLPEFHYFAALFETLAHLVHLEHDGKVMQEEVGGKVFWRKVQQAGRAPR